MNHHDNPADLPQDAVVVGIDLLFKGETQRQRLAIPMLMGRQLSE